MKSFLDIIYIQIREVYGLNIFFASVQVLAVLLILALLVWWSRLTRHIKLRGLKLVIAGVVLVLLGKVFGLLNEFESLDNVFKAGNGRLLDNLETIVGGVLGQLTVVIGMLLLGHSIYVVLSTKKNIDQSDEQYRLITENISDVIFLIDLNFNWLYITPSVLRFRGYTAEEALKQKINDILTPESIKKVRSIVRKEFLRDSTPGLDPNRVQHLELEFYHKDGRTVTGEVTASFLRDEEGRIIGLQGSNRDVTKRKLVEKALKESEERFRQAFMLIPEAVALNRLSDGMFVEYNQQFLETSGYSPEDIEGRTMLEVGLWADLGERELFLNTLKEKGTIQDFEVKFKKKNGEIGTGLTSATLVNLSGETHLLNITKDISDIRATQLALQESEAKFRSTLEAIGDCVIILDNDFNITWANDQAQEKIGTQEGAKCYEVFMGLETPCVECNARLTFEDGRIRTTEKQFLSRGNGNDQFLVTCAPLLDSQSNITSVVETIKDISDLKEAEARLVKTIQEKESLLQEIHHRVKNNLQAISGLLDIQAMRSDDPVSEKVIRESQNRIISMAMIHEHLYRHPDLSNINFTSYTQKLVQNLKRSYGKTSQIVSIEVKGQDIMLNPDTAIPCSLVLTELVSNALQHAFEPGKDGRIIIEFGELEKGVYSLKIEDNGRGLPEELDISSTDSFGLMLVGTFIDLLDGNLDIVDGDGTAFNITFREYEEAQTLTV